MAEQIRKRTFYRTADALAEYDAGEAARLHKWDAAKTDEDVFAAAQEDDRAQFKVAQAFHEDTADINSIEHCRHAGLAFMRRMAKESAQ